MSDKAWKQFERRVSGLFGTTRTPLSGGNGKVTRSDTFHEHFFIECKQRAASDVWTLFANTKPQAKKEKKIPVLALSRKRSPGFLVVVHNDDLPEFILKLLQDNKKLQAKVLKALA